MPPRSEPGARRGEPRAGGEPAPRGPAGAARVDGARALVDRFGRAVTYVRLSVADRCDFRCVYRMTQDMRFPPRSDVLTLDALAALARACVALGVRRIRLTGGEPLVRPGLTTLVERIARLPGLDELALTTNGARLAQFAAPLKAAGLARVNVSLDSLREDRFGALTRTGRLRDVPAGIAAAKRAGFRRIRLNCVILRGRNDDEVLDLVRFARAQRLDLAFIEEMPLGAIDEHDRASCFVSSDEVLARIRGRYALFPSDVSTGGPARYFRMADSEIRVGVIAPHSHNFCGDCNRVRVTASGRLLLCLGNEHGAELRDVLRTSPGDDARLRGAIAAAMPLKPERHRFDLDAPHIVRFMNMTGGGREDVRECPRNRAVRSSLERHAVQLQDDARAGPAFQDRPVRDDRARDRRAAADARLQCRQRALRRSSGVLQHQGARRPVDLAAAAFAGRRQIARRGQADRFADHRQSAAGQASLSAVDGHGARALHQRDPRSRLLRRVRQDRAHARRALEERARLFRSHHDRIARKRVLRRSRARQADLLPERDARDVRASGAADRADRIGQAVRRRRAAAARSRGRSRDGLRRPEHARRSRRDAGAARLCRRHEPCAGRLRDRARVRREMTRRVGA
ncbi:GTP 3',8-cyclase MoaA [Burkholderia pseudomallei]|nr:GTP 3',8-cyclase MoaA [Burkholderia pseudomallei]